MADLSSIRDYIRESSLIETDDWSNAKILNVINEGVRVVSNRFRWPWLAGSANLSVVADTDSYALTSIDADITSLEAITVNGRRQRLREVSIANALADYGGDLPESRYATHFFIWGADLHLIPTPSENVTDAYKVYYYKKPTELSNDSDTPEWDSRFHLVLAYWGLRRVWEREEDMEKADYWNAQFEAEVDRMAAFYLNRASDSPAVVGLGMPTRRVSERVHLPVLDG